MNLCGETITRLLLFNKKTCQPVILVHEYDAIADGGPTLKPFQA